MNKVILIGNLGRDPEVKYMQNGDAACNLAVATTESWKDKATGEKKELTEWHRVSMFGKVAEIAGQYLKKGSSVYIEGSLRTRKWTDKDGQERYTTEIRCDQMKMLGGRPDGGNEQPAPQRSAPQQQQRSTPQQQQRSTPAHNNGFADMDDDIPF